MAFRYEYKPQRKSNVQKAVVAAAVVVLVLSLYTIGTTVTGYFTYSTSIEQELNKTQSELTIYKSVSEKCTRDLWQTGQNLSRCEGALGSTHTALQTCNKLAGELTNKSASLDASLASCSSELLGLKGVYGSLNISYEKLVKSSVKAICCSFGDVQQATTRNWDVMPDGIICSGSFSVNCSSGETF